MHELYICMTKDTLPKCKQKLYQLQLHKHVLRYEHKIPDVVLVDVSKCNKSESQTLYNMLSCIVAQFYTIKQVNARSPYMKKKQTFSQTGFPLSGNEQHKPKQLSTNAVYIVHQSAYNPTTIQCYEDAEHEHRNKSAGGQHRQICLQLVVKLCIQHFTNPDAFYNGFLKDITLVLLASSLSPHSSPQSMNILLKSSAM